MTDWPHSREPARGHTPALDREGPNAPEGKEGAPQARLGWLIFWMSGTLLSFIVAALAVRTLSEKLNAFEMMSVRSAGGLIILFLLTVMRPDLLEGLRAHRMGLQTVRSVVNFVSQICWTIAITVLPFATVFALRSEEHTS